MSDYEALDLGPVFNAAREFHSTVKEPRIGGQTFRGLPFAIGTDPARCYIGLEPGAGSVEIPVGRAARWVIFAHTLLDSRVLQGENVGTSIARYLLEYADGTELGVPIRDRFEINPVPTTWGQLPFLAVPDQNDTLAPRWEGRWEGMGRRQAEAVQAYPHSYFLWALQNPRPDSVIAAIRIQAADRRFLVAAITLSHLEEEPFPRQVGREVLVQLPSADDAQKPFELEVEVDRGTATYPHPLPATSVAEFESDPLRGWGEAPNRASSPAYVQIAASPSATVTVRGAGEELGSVNWGRLQAEGRIEQPRVALEVADRGKNWVHVTVLDDSTGRPTPCRVHFRSPEGIPYQPHGHHNHVNSHLGSWHMDIGGDLRLGQISYAYIDGRCQGWLPRGEVVVDIAKGFEYQPIRRRVTIQPGQRQLELRLKRWSDLPAQGWWSGDTHVHFLGTQGAHREAQGEDLNVVNLLQSQWGHLFTNTEDWIGRPTVSDDGRTIVYCTQENRQHLLGHLTLLGLREPVMPWCSDGPGEAELGGSLEVTMSHWADACHAQGGTVVLPHVPNPNGEPAVLIATGRADAVEMLVHGDYQHLEYYRYLNCGYRLPIVGGTDKMTSDVPVGLYRTYALLDPEQPFNYESWCHAMRAGRTFLSGGAILRFTVDGKEIGDTLHLSAGGGTVEVEVTAESIFPIHTLQVVQAGKVVAQTEDSAGARRLHLRERLQVNGNTWLAARCGGPGYSAVLHHDGWRRGIFAHTSPIYVACGGEWSMFDPDTAQYMLTLVQGGIDYIRTRAPLHSHGTVTHHHHHHNHQEFLEEPFHQAAAAIHRRMHAMGIPH